MPEPNDGTENVKATQENSSEQKGTPQQENAPAEKNPLHDYEWMVKECDMYKEEYDDCTSLRARFHQYFVFGKITDCKQWKTDYHNCYLWEKYKSQKALAAVIESEKQRRLERLKGHYKNNVWERRTTPPENWNAPLPEWMQAKYAKSYLRYMRDEMKKPQSEVVAENEKPKSSCTIM